MASEWENRECKIVIVGSGVFGLATALELSRRDTFSKASITVIDKGFPYPAAASIDHCRIIRTDYKEPLYRALALEAQRYWSGNEPETSPFGGRLGEKAHYTEYGLIEAAHDPTGRSIIAKILDVWRGFEPGVMESVSMIELPSREKIREASRIASMEGDFGYILGNAGWVDAEAGTRFLREIVDLQKRVVFIDGIEVTGLISSTVYGKMQVAGVRLSDGREIPADLTILASGVWTGDFEIPGNNLEPTGTATAYIQLSEQQMADFHRTPTICNLTHGVSASFLGNGLLKVSRYAPEEGDQSVPFITGPYDPDLTISEGDIRILRSGLHSITPVFDDSELSGRVCWNTASGNFIVTYPPSTTGLFVAAGGHAYKFLPVIGKEVVDIIVGNPAARFQSAWSNWGGLGPMLSVPEPETQPEIQAERERQLAIWKAELLNSRTPGDFCVC